MASLKGICGLSAAVNQVKLDPHFTSGAEIGTLNFSGTGTVTLTTAQNIAGTIKTKSQSGSYSVNADGRSGTIDLSVSGGPVLGFLIVAGGQELRFINTGTASSTTGLVDSVEVGQCDF